MEETNGRRRKADGIEIYIKLRKTKYDLFVDIATGTDISRKIKGDGFTLKLTYFDGTTQVKEPLHFERIKKPHKRKGGKLVETVYIVKTEEYKLSVILEPSLYASTKTIKEMEKCQEKSKSKKRKVGAMPSRDGYPLRSSRPTHYTRNNVFRPYQGGRCSPK